MDQYFGALNAGDNQTLSSFAMVTFKDKVQKWTVTATSPEKRSPALLSELVAKAEAARDRRGREQEGGRGLLTRERGPYNRYVEVKDKTKMPANLEKFAADWQKFEQTDKDLQKQISENKAAVEKERKNVQLSVGQVEGLDTMTGEVVDKTWTSPSPSTGR